MNTQFNCLFVSFRVIAGMFWMMCFPLPGWAQQQNGEHPAHPLASVNTLLVEIVALSERGLENSSAITKTITDKLSEAGFTVVSSPDQPHEAVIRVKCEERQTWTGPSKYRSISPVPTSRLWKGPACHISYRYQDSSPQWKWDVRTSFEDIGAAAEAQGASNTGTFALNALNTELQQDDFPLFILAEWEQTDRLLMLLQKSQGNSERQITILQLLGTISSDKAFNALQDALSHPPLIPTALLALGQQGETAIPILITFLETTLNSEHRLTAIQALGAIATYSKDPMLFTQFIQLLDSEDPKVQTEAVKGLGNLGDRRAIQPLEKLNLQAWTNPSSSPDMRALREMLSSSLWQLRPDAHTGG
jgi:HEAT repeat protein